MTDVAFQRIESLFRQGLKRICTDLGDPEAAEAFRILDPSPPREGDPDRSVHISRAALASEGEGQFTQAMRTIGLHDMADEDVADRFVVRCAAVALVRTRMREREIARLSPDDADPAWACHVHVLLDAVLRAVERDLGIDRHAIRTFDRIDQERAHPFGTAYRRTCWSRLLLGADDRRHQPKGSASRLTSGRIELHEMLLKPDAMPIDAVLTTNFRAYCAIVVGGLKLPDTVAAGLPGMEGLPVSSLLDMPLLDGIGDMALRYPSYGEDGVRMVLPDRRILMGPPPSGADLSFLTIGRDLLNHPEDDIVLAPAA